MTKKREKIGCVIFTLLAGIFILLPIYSAMISGVFRWHITQKILWKDAIEIFIYISIIAVFAVLAKKKKGLIVLVIGCVYLLSVGTLQECVVSYAYIEIILFIGRSCLSIFIRDKKMESVGISFLVGSLLWGFFAIVMSFLQRGTIDELRMLTLVLFILAIINPRNKNTCDDILLVRYIKYLNRNNKRNFIINLFFITVMLISAARVNTFIEYDSSWYGLYPEKCLFGEHSFYEYLGYTEFVYYYPKFKELLMAPISDLGMEGYLISSNLWIMLICVIEVYDFLVENIDSSDNKNQILGVVYLIFSSVCIVGISGTAKSDTISYLYMLLLVIYFVKYLNSKDQLFLWISISSGIMSYTVKYTSFLWSTLIFITVFTMLIWLLLRKKIKLNVPNIFCMLLIFFALFIFFGTIYRTFKLTGYPTYRAGKGLWEMLGFQPRPYFDNNGSSITVFDLKRIYSVFFDVNNAGKITAQWTGNYSLFLGLCSLLLFRDKQKNTHKFLMIITVTLLISSIYYLVTQRAPDGNYFSIGIIIITCYVFIRITESRIWCEHVMLKKWFIKVIWGFMLLNLCFVFITHPSWGTGTRFSNNSISLYVSEDAKYESRKKSMEARGIYEINERLKETTDGSDFLLTDGASNMCMLEGRVEIVSGIFNRSLSAANIDDYQDFNEYIDYVGVNGFVIARDDSGNQEFDEYVKQYIAENGYIDQVDTVKYSYYKIR